MEKELMHTFLNTLFWSETGSNPITRRYAHNLVAAGITDLWTLLKTDSGTRYRSKFHQDTRELQI